MDTVIAFLSLAFFVAFFIGLIKPSLVRMPSRKRASAVYLGGGFVLSIIGSILYPTEKASQLLKLKHQPLQNTKSKKHSNMVKKHSRNIGTSQRKLDTIL